MWLPEVTVGRPLAVLMTFVFVLLRAGSASAEPPLEVTDRITDEVDALGAGASAAQEAVDELSAESEIELYAVFVSTFEAEDGNSWIETTAELSELAGSDMLFAVAVGEETYEYEWWVTKDFLLSEVDVRNVLTSDVAPALEDGNWSGAVISLAERLQSQSGSEEVRQSRQWSATTTLVVVGGLAVVLLVAHQLSRRRGP